MMPGILRVLRFFAVQSVLQHFTQRSWRPRSQGESGGVRSMFFRFRRVLSDVQALF